MYNIADDLEVENPLVKRNSLRELVDLLCDDDRWCQGIVSNGLKLPPLSARELKCLEATISLYPPGKENHNRYRRILNSLFDDPSVPGITRGMKDDIRRWIRWIEDNRSMQHVDRAIVRVGKGFHCKNCKGLVKAGRTKLCLDCKKEKRSLKRRRVNNASNEKRNPGTGETKNVANGNSNTLKRRRKPNVKNMTIEEKDAELLKSRRSTRNAKCYYKKRLGKLSELILPTF